MCSDPLPQKEGIEEVPALETPQSQSLQPEPRAPSRPKLLGVGLK